MVVGSAGTLAPLAVVVVLGVAAVFAAGGAMAGLAVSDLVFKNKTTTSDYLVAGAFGAFFNTYAYAGSAASGVDPEVNSFKQTFPSTGKGAASSVGVTTALTIASTGTTTAVSVQLTKSLDTYNPYLNQRLGSHAIKW